MVIFNQKLEIEIFLEFVSKENMNFSNLWGDFLITICVYREGEKEKKEERERKIYLSIFTSSRT
jgi:hypothetical protein